MFRLIHCAPLDRTMSSECVVPKSIYYLWAEKRRPVASVEKL
jgi:hypothetical protein